MQVTLYDAFVPGCLQILHALHGLIDKAQAHCAQQGVPPADLIHARLAPDMFDFAYQVKSCAVHSMGAIEGIRRGTFSPDMTTPPDSFEGLKAKISEAIQALEALSAADVEALSDAHLTFTIKDTLLGHFTGKDFLLSFSQPNFYFHASTAYGLLRMKGVPLGKRDYLGAYRMTP